MCPRTVLRLTLDQRIWGGSSGLAPVRRTTCRRRAAATLYGRLGPWEWGFWFLVEPMASCSNQKNIAEIFMRWLFVISSRSTQDVERNLYLLGKAAPQLNGIVGVKHGKAHQWMILGALHCWFCDVDAMVVRLDELDFYFFWCDVVFDGTGAFVVQHV